MDEVLINLKNRIRHLAQGIRDGVIMVEDVDEEVYKIIDAAVELYRREDIELLMPMNNGGPLFFTENGIYFIPIYSCKEEIKECEALEYRNICFKSVLELVEGMIERSGSDTSLSGVMLDPESDDLFSFDSWIMNAVIAKGRGADSFKAFDKDTGELRHDI